MVLGLGCGRRVLFVVVGAEDVPGVIGPKSSLVCGVSGRGVVLCLGRGRRVLVRCDVFGANVVTGASVLTVTGSMSVVGTMVIEGASVSNATGSETDLVGGMSGSAVVWGLGSNCFGGFEPG